MKHRSFSRLAAIVLVTMLPVLAARAADATQPAAEAVPPGVLIIHSNQRPTAAGIVIEDTLRTVVPAALKRPVGLYSEYLDEEWTEYPQRQKAASFNLQDVMDKMQEGGR